MTVPSKRHQNLVPLPPLGAAPTSLMLRINCTACTSATVLRNRSTCLTIFAQSWTGYAVWRPHSLVSVLTTPAACIRSS